MTLSKLIKEYREYHDISMDSFAKACGLSKSYISMLESDRHPKTGDPIKPSVDTYAKIAKGMHLSVQELFDRLGNSAPFQSDAGEAKDLAEAYYVDQRTAEIAQEIKDSKELSALFDVQKDLPPEDLQAVYQMVLALKRKEQG